MIKIGQSVYLMSIWVASPYSLVRLISHSSVCSTTSHVDVLLGLSFTPIYFGFPVTCITHLSFVAWKMPKSIRAFSGRSSNRIMPSILHTYESNGHTKRFSSGLLTRDQSALRVKFFIREPRILIIDWNMHAKSPIFTLS